MVGMPQLERYTREAKEHFHPAMGDGFTMDDPNFMATGGAVSQQEPYRVIIVNASTTTDETAILFGQYKYGNVSNFGSGADITITMGTSNVTYAQMLNQSAQEPFEVVLTRIETTNATQLSQSMLLKKSDASGESAERPITVSSYNSPDQYQTNKTDVAQNYRIDGNTAIEYKIYKATTVTISFFVSAKVNTALPLNGQAPIREFTSQRVRTFGSTPN